MATPQVDPAHGSRKSIAPEHPSEDTWIEMRDRLRFVIDHRSSEAVGRLTGVSGESVRRYLMGHVPSSRFLSQLCLHDSIDGTWLLTGVGCARRPGGDISLESISTDQLLAEVGRRLDRLAGIPLHSLATSNPAAPQTAWITPRHRN